MSLKDLDKIRKYKTVNGIYSYLKREGITGIRFSNCECPIAQLIHREAETEIHTVSVSKDNILCSFYSSTGFTQYNVTPAITRFIEDFDLGIKYQDLIPVGE